MKFPPATRLLCKLELHKIGDLQKIVKTLRRKKLEVAGNFVPFFIPKFCVDNFATFGIIKLNILIECESNQSGHNNLYEFTNLNYYSPWKENCR